MSQTITNKVVPLLGVLAMLLALLVPQTTAFASDDIDDDPDAATGDDPDDADETDETDENTDDTNNDEVANTTTDDGEDAGEVANDAPARGEDPNDLPSTDGDGIDDDDLVIESFEEALPPEGETEIEACPRNSLEHVASPDTSVSSELTFTVELENAHAGPCYVYVQTYTVPVTWNQAGFNATATPQDTFDDEKVVLGGEQASSATVTIARPDCGPYQWDVYSGDFVETVDAKGHHGLGSGVWLFRGVVVDQDLCQPSHLTFMTECEALVAERGEWKFRVRNPNNVDIEFSWAKYQDDTVTGTGTALAGEDTFFTVPTDELAIGEAIHVFTTGRDGEPKLWATNNPGGFKNLAECGLALDLAKIVCDDYADVPQNVGGDNPNPPLGIGNIDLTDGGYAASKVNWKMTDGWLDVGDEIAAATSRGCQLAEWTFNFYDNGGSLLDSVTSSADGVVAYPLEGDVLQAALAGTLHVAESFDNMVVDTATVPPYFSGGPQDGEYRFGSLRCAQDGVNLDNRETIRLANVSYDDPIGCVAYNVPTTEQVQPAKLWAFDGTPGEELSADLPEGMATITVTVEGEEEIRGSWDFPTSSMLFRPVLKADIRTAETLIDDDSVSVPRDATLVWGETYEVPGYTCTPTVMTIDAFFGEMDGDSPVEPSEFAFDQRFDHVEGTPILIPGFDGITHVVVNDCVTIPPTVIPSTPTTEVEDSAVEPDARLDDVCVDDATAVEVTYTLDNSESTEPVTFLVEIDGEDDLELEVAAGDTVTGIHTVGDEDGSVAVAISVDGEPIVSGSFSTDDCATDDLVEVLPEDGEEADPTTDPTPDPAPETDRIVQVEGGSQEVTATRAALPMTGASALLLSVLGLLGLGLGGAMVRPRRRD